VLTLRPRTDTYRLGANTDEGFELPASSGWSVPASGRWEFETPAKFAPRRAGFGWGLVLRSITQGPTAFARDRDGEGRTDANSKLHKLHFPKRRRAGAARCTQARSRFHSGAPGLETNQFFVPIAMNTQHPVRKLRTSASGIRPSFHFLTVTVAIAGTTTRSKAYPDQNTSTRDSDRDTLFRSFSHFASNEASELRVDKKAYSRIGARRYAIQKWKSGARLQSGRRRPFAR